MSFAERHNKGSKFTWQAPEGSKAVFKKLSDYPVDTTFKIVAIYINTKGKFKDHPVFITDQNIHLDIPAGNMDDVKEILNSSEDIADINAGKVGIEVTRYESKQYGTQAGFKFIDL